MATPGSRFVWHELETTDPTTAIDYYRKVVGWKEQASEAQAHGEPYRMLAAGTTAVAGVMALDRDMINQGAMPSWLCYVSVASVDESTRKAEGLGARTLVPPTDIPGTGRFSVLLDPQLAPIALFTPLPMPGMGPSDGEAALLDWCWHEYVARDWQAGWRFYSALFGWEEAERMEMGDAGTYFMYRRPGTKDTMGGFYTKPAEMPGPSCWLPYVRVPNSDAAAALVTKHGGKTLHAGDVPGGGRIAMCLDAEGAMFALHTFPADLKHHAAARRAGKTARKPAARKATKKSKKTKKITKKRAAPKKKTARKAAKKTVKKRK